MRQYCSGGSRTWSSIQPLSGVCSSGWLRKKRNTTAAAAAPGATSAMAASTSVDVLEDEAGDDGVEGGVGGTAASAAAAADVGRAARALRGDLAPGPTSGRRPTTTARPAADGQPGDLAFAGARRRAHDAAPARCSAASGRICSSYSGSAPSVKPSCHQPAWRPPTGPRRHCPCRRGPWRGRRRATVSGSQGRPCSSSRARLLRPRRTPPSSFTRRLLARRAEAGDVVEHARGHALAAQLAVVGDGEAVGLVADALQQVERLGLPRGSAPGRPRPGT